MNATKPKEWTPERIREFRESRRWTLLEAAERVGVKPRTWLSWELSSQGRKPPKSRVMLLEMLESGKI